MKSRWWLIVACLYLLLALGEVYDATERGEVTLSLVAGAAMVVLAAAGLVHEARRFVRWCWAQLRGRLPGGGGEAPAVPRAAAGDEWKLIRSVQQQPPLLIGGVGSVVAAAIATFAPWVWRADLLIALLVGMGVLAGLVLTDDE